MVAFYIIFFNIVGNFGNFHIIYLTMTRKELRGKSAYLQCASSFFHAVCLLYELFNAYFLIFGIQLRRYQCYPIESGYVVFASMQTVCMLMMLVDILSLVLLPMRYRTYQTGPYVLKMLIPGFVFGMIFAIWGFMHMDDEVLIFCNPPIALIPSISHTWMACNFAINSTVFALLVVIIILMHYRGKGRGETQRVVRRLKVITAIFVFSWYSATLGHTIINIFFDEESTLSVFLTSNMIFFVLIIYSQAFYVIMWRSKEYRSAFIAMYSNFAFLQRFAPSTITVTVTSSVVQTNSREPVNRKSTRATVA
ncbi:unnamed protein product [Caenorhabditis auriculariae]|uniref:G-protein coupled receptors family 1 profile domain-containing protein n=1 Tax=Caenorhabditis auriculariae TaxID=2777116 RepID=A0A8S1HV32_9PELO|nr:unnamed protein product [Caenorhabditis auriculariae]